MRVAEATHVQGAKVAILSDSAVVTYLRDNYDHIPNPNQWDLPGGVREEGETALSCTLRETNEEFGICLSRESIIYEATYFADAAGDLSRREVAFFVFSVSSGVISTIKFGNEGQYWRMMRTEEFLNRSDAVPELQRAFGTFCTHRPLKAD